MLSKDNILNFLLEQDKLWQSETKHEAMLLYKSLYKNSPEHRERVVDYVLIGPPLSRGKVSEDDIKYTEHQVFLKLKYLEEQNLELTLSGKKYLEKIKVKYPKWKMGHDADIEAPIHVRRHENLFTIEQIYLKSPNEVALMLRDYKGTWERERSDFCNAVGITCRQYPEWALELFHHLSNIVTELPEDTINPIIWEIRSNDEKEKVTWSLEQIHCLKNILQDMVEKRPVAELWKSVPGLLQSWQKTYKVDLDFLDTFINRLANIFKSFDYEREEKAEPVDWINRAINHPYGDLTELYLESAQQLVSEQEKADTEYEIDTRIIHFFEFTIKNYDCGTRYGLCLFGRWLNWYEVIMPNWTEETLLPAFNWNNNEEMALIAWSGYLWNRTLSRFLSEQFDNFFINAGRHYKRFRRAEQEGLTAHVAGLVWFKNIDITNLKKFVSLPELDREGRINILGIWEFHLERSQKHLAESFWNTIIIPYWDWCERQRYLALPDGDTERFKFWDLLPLSYEAFPKAAKRAIHLAPSRLDQVYAFPERLLKTNFSTLYPEEFSNLLLVFIQADQNPLWHKDVWEKLWDSVKNSGTKKLTRLRDELARKKVISE
jgi:hypothetical protein